MRIPAFLDQSIVFATSRTQSSPHRNTGSAKPNGVTFWLWHSVDEGQGKLNRYVGGVWTFAAEMLAWLQRQRNRALILDRQSLYVKFGQGILLLEGSLAALKELLLACPCTSGHRK